METVRKFGFMCSKFNLVVTFTTGNYAHKSQNYIGPSINL
jgi:hypothetical protein